MVRTAIRIGGVPEHFNLPWRLAIEEGAFDALGLDVEWVDFPGGTGAIMGALATGELDLATPLTEGAVTAIARGNPSRLVGVFVDSPLLWGAHVAADSDAETIDDCRNARIAISRPGSGSELIALVMADERGWTLAEDVFVAVGGLDGAREALPAGEADLFLWNKSMTQPSVDDGTFKRVGVYPTPWPSFVTVAGEAFAQDQPDLVHVIAETAAHRAAALHADDSAAMLVMDRYDLDLDDVIGWLEQVRWTAPGAPIDEAMLTDVVQRMRTVGRIDEPVDVTALVHPRR